MERFVRILTLLSVLAFLAGCTSLQYSYEPVPVTTTGKPAPVRLGVLRLTDRTDGKHSKSGDTVVDPMGELAQGLTQGLKDANVFENVVFCDEMGDRVWTDASRLRSTYNIDAVLVGDVHTLRVSDGPNPVSFIVFPLGLGMLAGIPSGVGWNRMEFAANLKLIDLHDKETLWQDRFTETHKETVFVSAYTIANAKAKFWNRRLNRFVADAVVRVSEERPRLLARERRPSLSPTPMRDSKSRPVSVAGTGRRWAIVVGVSRYKHTGDGGLTDLPFAQDDARMFASFLIRAGWSRDRVKCITDEQATERNVRILLESWLTKAGPEDVIVLYWAGHGFPDPEDPERVYFACHDTDVRIPATGYRMDRIRDTLAERKVRNVVVLADTCHAGKLVTRGERGLSVVPGVQHMQQREQVPKGWVFMVGADADRKAVEHSSWQNGAFTHCLLQGLGGKADGFQSAGRKDGTVTLGELRAYLTTAMPDETQKVLGVAKHPLITTSTGDPDIWNLTLQAK